MITKPIVEVLNTSTFTPIKIPTNPPINPSNCNPICAYTEDESAWIMADDQAGTDPVRIPGTKSYNNECLKADQDGTILYAKATAGTPNLAVLVGVELKKR